MIHVSKRYVHVCRYRWNILGSWWRHLRMDIATNFNASFNRVHILREDACIYRQILNIRAMRFNDGIRAAMEVAPDSPIFDCSRISILFDVYDIVMNMIFMSHTYMYSQKEWKSMAWGMAWEIEDNDWTITSLFYKSLIQWNQSSLNTHGKWKSVQCTQMFNVSRFWVFGGRAK